MKTQAIYNLPKTRFEQVCDGEVKPRSNKERVWFHYFNKDGLYERKRKNNKRISELVSEDKCKPGAILAYGSLDDHGENELRRLSKKKRVSRIEYKVWHQMFVSGCESAEAFIKRCERNEHVPN